MRKFCILLFALNAFGALGMASAVEPRDPLIEMYDKTVEVERKKIARVVANNPALQDIAALWEALFQATLEQQKVYARYLAEHPDTKAYFDTFGLPFYVTILPKTQNTEVLQSGVFQNLKRQIDEVLAAMALKEADNALLTKALRENRNEIEQTQLKEFAEARLAEAVALYGNGEAPNSRR